jgi:dTDP-4-amino-4,6-dideoxygalactose transaminase
VSPATSAAAPERLARDGGPPALPEPLPYARQVVDEDDVAAVTRALRSGWLTCGPQVDGLERDVAERVGTRHAVAYSSGTAALHGAAFAAGVGPGDEVIVPTLTFSASAACVLYQGGEPVLADVEPGTLNLDPGEVARRIGPRTRAIVAVHYAGTPADMEAIGAIARRRGVVLIEDAAHAPGARTAAGACGSLGDMGVFSLHPAKQLTAGEGGVVTTDRDDLAERLRRFRTHCMDRTAHERERGGGHAYDIAELGWNYRMSDLNAALGRSQLRKLDDFLRRRRRIAAVYGELLAGLPLEPPVVPEDVVPAWHLYVVRLRLEELDADRDAVFAALRAENVGVNVHYRPLHLLSLYAGRGYRPGDLPVAEDAYRRMITLPLHAGMGVREAEGVCRAVRKVLGAYAA